MVRKEMNWGRFLVDGKTKDGLKVRAIVSGENGTKAVQEIAEQLGTEFEIVSVEESKIENVWK